LGVSFQGQKNRMNKDKGFVALAIILALCGFALYISMYFLSDWLSTITTKKYSERPEWSPAPVPYTDQSIKHYESSSACGGEQIYDGYYVDKPAEDVEAYYHQEMEKYCLSSQGWQVTFTTMSCYGWDEIGTQDCRYAACVLRDEAPSLREDFSVEIFPISSTETFVFQNHGMFYLHTTPSNVQCGE
jgi:hypothetical protein